MDKRKLAVLLKNELLKMDTIPVGNLVFHGSRNNDAYHDNGNVFCKVTRSNMSPQNLWRELEFVKTFIGHIPSFTPWVTQLVEIPTHRGPRWASAWLWEKNVNPIYPHTVDSKLGEKMAEGLNKIHALPYQPFIKPLTDDVMNYNLETRLKISEKYNPSAEHVKILKELFRRYISPQNFRFHDLVINHGDCHVKNFVNRDSGHSWIDFEAVRMAPREWDIATLALASRQFSNRQQVWSDMLNVFNSEGPVKPDLVNFFEIVKGLSTTSYLLLKPASYDIFENRVEVLEPLLRDTKFPDTFPIYSSTI